MKILIKVLKALGVEQDTTVAYMDRAEAEQLEYGANKLKALRDYLQLFEDIDANKNVDDAMDRVTTFLQQRQKRTMKGFLTGFGGASSRRLIAKKMKSSLRRHRVVQMINRQAMTASAHAVTAVTLDDIGEEDEGEAEGEEAPKKAAPVIQTSSTGPRPNSGRLNTARTVTSSSLSSIHSRGAGSAGATAGSLGDIAEAGGDGEETKAPSLESLEVEWLTAAGGEALGAEEGEWYYLDAAKERLGGFSAAAMNYKAKTGLFGDTRAGAEETLVWTTGWGDWQPLGTADILIDRAVEAKRAGAGAGEAGGAGGGDGGGGETRPRDGTAYSSASTFTETSEDVRRGTLAGAAIGSRCAGCELPIMESDHSAEPEAGSSGGSRLVLHAQGRVWHRRCFCCAECAEPFPKGEFVESEDGAAYCKKDYNKLFAPNSCGGCLEPLVRGDLIVEACNRRWHQHHFNCTGCDLDLGHSAEYFDRDEEPFCGECYMDRFLKCLGCGDVVAEDEAEGIFAMGRNWHRGHFKCFQCQTNLPDGVYYEGDTASGPRPFCEAHYIELYVPKCKRCDQHIFEGGMQACGGCWHNEHFHCSFDGGCTKGMEGTAFEKTTMMERSGLPYVETEFGH